MAVWPDGTTTQPTVSSAYGDRNGSFHTGADFVGFDTARAVLGGRVTHAGPLNDRAGTAVVIDVDDSDGVVTTHTYFHLNSVAVRSGTDVAEGAELGTVGWTGHVVPAGPAGKHLHMEVRFWRANGVSTTDPVPWIQDRTSAFAGLSSAQVASLMRSPAVEYIVRAPNGTVVHIVPGAKFNFTSPDQYNTWRRQLDRLRRAGATNALPMPRLARVADVDWAQFRHICQLNGVSPD